MKHVLIAIAISAIVYSGESIVPAVKGTMDNDVYLALQKEVTIDVKDHTLMKFAYVLQDQIGINVVCDPKIIFRTNSDITIKVDKMKAELVVEMIEKITGLKFKAVGKSLEIE